MYMYYASTHMHILYTNVLCHVIGHVIILSILYTAATSTVATAV